MKRPFLITLTCIVVAIALILGLLALFPTQFPYADGWILGRSREEITAVYGEPTGYDQSHMISYSLGKDRGFFGIMSSNNDIHYYIYFDNNGQANRILKGCQLGG